MLPPLGKHHKGSSLNLIFIGLVVALVTLSCAIGVLSPAEPFFTPPVGEAVWSATPDLIRQDNQPTPEPVSNPLVVMEATPLPVVISDPSPTPDNVAPILYYTQAGDTLPVVAVRFGVQPSEIISPDPIPETMLLHPNQLLIIPRHLENTTSSAKLLPDSDLVYSPSAIDFDAEAFVGEAGGYLSTYHDWLGSTGDTSGVQIIERVAIENSINPRLLIALLEYQSEWVYSQPGNLLKADYPMGKVDLSHKGLYKQLVWAVNHLSVGYFGWREGLLTEIRFSDGVTARLAPDLNAGTVALQYFFSQLYDSTGWVQALDEKVGFPALYERMYGNPWARALTYEPLYPPDLTQPPLILPFLIGSLWSFTGGPHGAWEHDGARAALDFAPGSTEPGCVDSYAWVVASSPGLVSRTGHGIVVIDLDGDGQEQTGWVLLYLHLVNLQVQEGDWVELGDMLGHPSCEGGVATGTHVHIARKYNGEWIPADGPLPFNLDGWIAHAGQMPYQGMLTRDDEIVQVSVVGSFESRIVRERQGP
jgi:murein DD-endopeptidase MepM/ murein hydrolase activator NlpD